MSCSCNGNGCPDCRHLDVIRAVERVWVTRVTTLRGAGTSASRYREVESYWSDDGRKIGEHDPIVRDK